LFPFYLIKQKKLDKNKTEKQLKNIGFAMNKNEEIVGL